MFLENCMQIHSVVFA